jgi:hypothetical protein
MPSLTASIINSNNGQHILEYADKATWNRRTNKFIFPRSTLSITKRPMPGPA